MKNILLLTLLYTLAHTTLAQSIADVKFGLGAVRLGTGGQTDR